MKIPFLIFLCILQDVHSCSPLRHFQKIREKENEAIERHEKYIQNLRKEANENVGSYVREVIRKKREEFTALLNHSSNITTNPEKLKHIGTLQKTIDKFLDAIANESVGCSTDNWYDLVKYMKYDVHAYHFYITRGDITNHMLSGLNISTCKVDMLLKFSDVTCQIIEKVSDCAIDGFKKIPVLPYRIQDVSNMLVNARNTVSFSLLHECVNVNSGGCIDNIGDELMAMLSTVFLKSSYLSFPHVQLGSQKEETLKCMENEFKLFFKTLRETAKACR